MKSEKILLSLACSSMRWCKVCVRWCNGKGKQGWGQKQGKTLLVREGRCNKMSIKAVVVECEYLAWSGMYCAERNWGNCGQLPCLLCVRVC